MTLASARKTGSPFAPVTSPPRFMADVHVNLVAAMQRHGLRKIATMSSLGTQESFPNLFFLMKWLIRNSNLSVSYADHDEVDREMKETGLDFILARPARLTAGAKAPVKFFGNDGNGIGWFTGISRASVSAFLVDAVEQSTWDRSTPVIAN